MTDSRAYFARVLLYAAVGTLAVLPLSCHAARGDEIVRVAVDRPCIVIVERTAEGGVRVILEYRPKGAGPPSAPGPITMAAVVDRALSRPGVAPHRARVLAEVARALDAALEAAEAGRVTEAGTAYAMVATAAIEALNGDPRDTSDDIGTALAGPVAELVGTLTVGPGPRGVADRLAELKRIVEERR